MGIEARPKASSCGLLEPKNDDIVVTSKVERGREFCTSSRGPAIQGVAIFASHFLFLEIWIEPASYLN